MNYGVPMTVYENPATGLERLWSHAGLRCAAYLHDDVFHRCGYVGVPEGHPMYGLTDSRIYDRFGDVIHVHGGITYAKDHRPDVESDGLWWLGFDCGHGGDAADVPDECPYYIDETWYEFQIKQAKIYGAHVWTLEEVIDETERMADQINALAKAGRCDDRRNQAVKGSEGFDNL